MKSIRLTTLITAGIFAGIGIAYSSGVSAQVKVPVIHSAAPKWTGSENAWKVSATPMLEIGSADGADPYLFHNAMGVLKLSDGRIAVADMGSSQVRFYDSKGKHLKTIGRAGDGPGEFRQIAGLRRMNGDSILVIEFERASVTTADGKHVRVVRFPSIPSVAFARPSVWFSDASNISMDWPQGARRTGTWLDSVHTFLVDRNGAMVRPLGTFPAVTYAFKDEVAMPIQFAPMLSITSGTNEFFVAYPETYRINGYGLDGKPTRVISRAWQPVPVTAADIKQYGDGFVNTLSEGGSSSPQWRAFRQKRLDQTTFAKQMPAFGSMRTDTEGNLWVQEGRPIINKTGDGFSTVSTDPTRFDVFTPAGAWLGSVQTPPRFRVMDIGKDYIAGLYVGDEDIETIRFYRLTKPVAR
jgi:hypothetical protein